ncbi:MAG: BrnT family toxin [Gammaproteobacteria bacterium]
MKFEWDPTKEKINIQKHGVTFEQASYVFADPCALSTYDDEHSQEEDRWVLLGKSINEILLVVVHTFKDQDGTELVRIMSARRATKNETGEYQRRCP